MKTRFSTNEDSGYRLNTDRGSFKSVLQVNFLPSALTALDTEAVDFSIHTPNSG